MSAARARNIIAIALLLGVVGDISLRTEMPRLGLLLWVVLIVSSVLFLDATRPLEGEGSRRSFEDRLLSVALLIAPLGMVLRDAEDLYVLNVLSMLCLGALWIWSARGRGLRDFELEDAPRAALMTAREAATGAPALLRVGLADSGDGEGVAARADRRRDVVVGIVLAVPPLFIAARLLGSADPLLGEWLGRWSAIISPQTLGHLLAIMVITWIAMGWVWAVSRPLDGAGVAPRPPRNGGGFARIAPTLYGLCLLFAVFLGLQLRALFGGAVYLAETSGLTVAEYARGGFFDLVAVTAVVLGVLLVADRLLGDARESDARRFRTAGALLLMLVTVPILSAVARMSLYVSYFGLSIDRLNAFAGMLGIALALAWFGWTVLRGRRERFGPGILAITSLWVLSLNLVNPEAIVVRVNVARATAGQAFDVAYHLKLSADSRPALHDAVAVLPPLACRELRQGLELDRRSARFVPKDWQSWSVPTSARRLARIAATPECSLVGMP